MGLELRPYQKEAIKNFDGALKKAPVWKIDGVSQKTKCLKGRFIYPTGAGKTVIQSSIMKKILTDNNGHGIHVVLSPRIVLANQLMNEYRDKVGVEYDAVAFHSGTDPDAARVSWRESIYTDPANVSRDHQLAVENGRQLVVFSTYHSLPKLVQHGILFDSMIADESHYCTNEEFFNNVRDAQAGVKLFFTATERHAKGELSNGNIKVFGKVIGREKLSNLIKDKYLVKPKLHVLHGQFAKGTGCTFVDETVAIAQFHRENTNIGMKSKVLFACGGTKYVKKVIQNLDEIRDRLPGYRIFTILSDYKYGAMVDGEKVTRREFMGKLHACEENALIFHYDILTEGIDIDGITGCAIMRNMNQVKLLQTIGRCIRVYKADPDMKECAYVSVPVITSVSMKDDRLVKLTDRKQSKRRDNLKEVMLSLITGGFDASAANICVTTPDGEDIPVEEERVVEDDNAESADGEEAAKPAIQLDIDANISAEMNALLTGIQNEIDKEFDEQHQRIAVFTYSGRHFDASMREVDNERVIERGSKLRKNTTHTFKMNDAKNKYKFSNILNNAIRDGVLIETDDHYEVVEDWKFNHHPFIAACLVSGQWQSSRRWKTKCGTAYIDWDNYHNSIREDA